MNRFKLIMLTVVLTLATVFSTMAFAQRNGQPFNFAQRILSISQAVPIVTEVVVPVDGEDITASVPMTLNVALQVDLASPSIRSIETVASTGAGL